MRGQARVTIRDGAATAGVFTQTASRVVDSRPAIAEHIGYTPLLKKLPHLGTLKASSTPPRFESGGR